MRKDGVLIGLGLLVAGMASAADIYHDGWVDRNKNGQMDVYEDPSQPVETRVADLLERMTMEEKTCQMGTMYGYKRVIKDLHPTEGWKERVWKDGVANIDEHANGVRGQREGVEFEEHCEIFNEIQRWFAEVPRLGVPVDFTNEGIRGLCHRKASNFPSQLAVGAAWDRELVRKIGEVTGKEAKALGYSNIYSPILDTVRDPRWGRTVECYGESPFLIGELGKEQTLGLQSQGVASTVKHFAAYSQPHGGRDAKCRTDPQVPFRDMQEILLFPFEKVFTEAHPMGVMSSYNTYDGVPVTGNPYFLTELLRDTYGFNGYVVSDSGAVTRMYEQHKVTDTFEDAVVQAVNAGLNVRTTFKPMEQFIEPLRAAIKAGRISEETLNSRVSDVLRVKFELGLFDKPFADPETVRSKIHTPESEALTLEAARKAMVLLKNEDSMLPLDPKAIKKIAVVGPGANSKSPMISRYGPYASDVITPFEGLKNLLGDQVEVVTARGVKFKDKRFPGSDVMFEPPLEDEQVELDEAIAVAKDADVIVAVVGDSHSTVGECLSRTSLNLPGYQDLLVREMVKTGKPVVVVLMSGRAASINWIDKHVPAIMACWHGGEKVGQAVAETLFGENNPGGKLTITFPKTVGQIPMAVPHRNGAWGPQSYRPSPNGWGYTRIADPLYYFGYGLSYTTFKYDNLSVSPGNPSADDVITVTAEITNTGDRAGDEVVQLYIQDDVASVAPFEQVLRGFERVSLKPGETKKVTFTITPKRDLKMLDREKKWKVEPGLFNVFVADSSEKKGNLLEGQFTLH